MKPRNEKELRGWFRDRMGEINITPRWVEPALGSTPGIPDCFIMLPRSVPVFIELKWSNDDKKGIVKYEVQKEQRREIPKMVKDGFDVLFLIGREQSPLMAKPTDPVVNGMLDINQPGDLSWRGMQYDSYGVYVISRIVGLIGRK